MSEVVYNPPLWRSLSVYKTEGDIGLEIECEGNKFQKDDLPNPWVYHEDHSLRGEDNAEYVFQGPQKFEVVEGALDDLWSMFEEYGTELDDSNRTSVHVHLNAQNWYLPRLASFCALYFSVENVLTEWCGDHRVGNLFCLRASDAPAIIMELKKFIKKYGNYQFSDTLHYSALNLNALNKFGSLEIRTMRGTSDKETVLRWITILKHIYDLSAEFKDPRDIPGLFSGYGPETYLKKVIGPEYLNIRPEINLTNDEIRQESYRGIRLAQEICYAVDWNLVRPDTENPDVFKRKSRPHIDDMVEYLGEDAPPPTVSASPTELVPTSPHNSYLTSFTLAEYVNAYNLQNPSPAVQIDQPISEVFVSSAEWEDVEAGEF